MQQAFLYSRIKHEEPWSSLLYFLKCCDLEMTSCLQAFSHLTVSPNHLNILSEFPPNLKILLLQHSEDG